MLHVHYSNSIAVLADQLIERLAVRQDNPLAMQTVVVPHPEMGRWLTRRMASHTGICANINFELPAACLWRLIAQRNPEMPLRNPLDPEVLTLRLLAAFEQQPPAPLQKYLHGKDLVTALSLARQLAHLFDQYLIYRHQWILEWEAGGGHSWQAALWRQLSPPHHWHWAKALGWLFDCGHRTTAGVDESQSLELLALPCLPPNFVRVLAALAESTEITCYQWSPCAEYWGDIAGRSKSAAAPTEHLEIGNRLLGSLGCQLRDFSDLLLEYESSSCEHYALSDSTDCLSRLQSDILHLRNPPRSQAVDLDSIRFHACHSRRREVEVCHDQLLDLFEMIPGLKPHEVLVVAPAISDYAADIESTFGAAANPLPFRIIGPRKQAAGAAGTCLHLLRAMLEPIDSRSLLELLAAGPVARRFKLEAASRELISHWIEAAGGFGEMDRSSASGGKFNWEAAAQRLLLDSMLEDSRWQPGQMRAAGPVSSSDLDLLGAFLELLDALTATQAAAEQHRSLEDWCAWTSQVLDRFLLLDAQGEYEKQVVSTALERLRKRVVVAGFSAPVQLRLFLQLLEPEIETLAAGSQGIQGGITFASAASQRLVPARIIYALGLNDGAFPAAQSTTELDLIAKSPRRGDGNRRQDDRQILLEWLCTTGEVLVLSYIGRDIRDNSERAASPLVGELRDYLGWGGVSEGAAESGVTEHPAQAFSRRYGRSDGLFTYQANFMVDAVAQEQPGFLDQALPEPALEQVSLADLVNFLVNPARDFLRERLGAWLAIDHDPTEYLAPVTVKPLASYLLKQNMIEQQLAGWSKAQIKQWAQNDVAVPDTPLGAAAVRSMVAASTPTARKLRQLVAAQQARSLRASLAVGDVLLSGQVRDIYAQTRVIFRAGKAGSKLVLQLWVEHLFCNALESPGGDGISSIAVCEDENIEFAPIKGASQLLESLLMLYKSGQSRPLPLLPEASSAYAKTIGRGEQAALKAAGQALITNDRKRGDDAEVHIARMIQAGWVLDQDFQDTALAVWQPLLDQLQ